MHRFEKNILFNCNLQWTMTDIIKMMMMMMTMMMMMMMMMMKGINMGAP